MKLLVVLLLTITAHAQSPWYFGSGEAVNLTPNMKASTGIKYMSGSLDPSATAVNAPAGSLYNSTSGTVYVKQDAGLSTNWLPVGVAAPSSLSTINGQSGPAVSIATGSSGTDFNISSAANTITLNLPTASASNRGLLSTTDWSAFNSKEPAIAAGTTSQYWRGDKSWQTLDKTVVGLGNVDNTSDATKNSASAALTNKTIDADLNTITNIENADIKSGAAIDATKIADGSVTSTEFQYIGGLTSDAQTQINGKVAGVGSSVDGEMMLFDSTTGKASKRATGSGFVKATSGVYSTQSSIALNSDVGASILPLVNGGTSKNLVADNGGVVYSDADSMEITAAGTSGQILKSNGAAAPTWVTPTTKMSSNTYNGVSYQSIIIPNDQLTERTVGTDARIETGNKNILADPSFEKYDFSSWTNNGTEVGIEEVTTIIDGRKSIVFSPSSETINLVQSSTLYASNFADGVQCLASMRIKSNLSAGTLSLCAVQAGTVSTTDCVTVNNDNKWGLYKIPFLCGGTSNGISLAGSSLTGTVYADDAYVGAPDLTQNQAAIGPWTTFTPTGSWSTNTTYAGKYRQVGQNLEINYRISTSGAPTTANLTVNLPSGFTIDVTKLASGAGANVLFPAIGVVNDSGTSFTEVSAYYSSTTALLLTIKGSAGTYVVDNNPITQAVPITFGAGDSVDVFVTVPIVELNGNITTYNAQCGANCADVFSADVSAAGVVSNESSDWINGNCSVSTADFTCTHNSGIFTVTPNCVAMPRSAADRYAVKLTASSSAATGVKTGVASTGADSATAFQLICQKQGADFTASRLIQGTFKNMSQYPGINRPKTCIYAFGGASATLASPTECTTGTCTEVYDSCSAGTAPSWATTAVYNNTTFANGTWANSSPLYCDCNAYDTTAGNARDCRLYFDTSDSSWSTNASGGAVLNTVSVDTSAQQTTYQIIQCVGESP